MIQSAVGLLTSIPTAFVHALNLLITSARPLMLLGTGDGHEAVDLSKTDVSQQDGLGGMVW